ncbi:MAG: nucleotidyltransferase domain-containing protein [Gemmatimonadales bacterium]|nr:nucleotidyltransferase domain-containing protein [Gemmatimonadales bacterium]
MLYLAEYLSRVGPTEHPGPGDERAGGDGRTMTNRAQDWLRQALRDLEQAEGLCRYFGSYARGDWGVGSDLDVVMIVDDSPEPFERRAARWDATRLPVPADVLVYTRAEWERLSARPREVVWVTGHPS